MKNKHICNSHCETMASITLIRDTAQYYANKYKYDPFIGRIHQEYSEILNTVLEADKGVVNV
jgi:hypothetical protein